MTGWTCQDGRRRRGASWSWWAKQGPMTSAALAKLSATATTPREEKKPGWLGSLRHVPPSCSPTLDSPRDCRPREEQHPAGCARKGRASGKESATSPAPAKATPGPRRRSARPAPGSSESGPPPSAPRGPPAGLLARAALRPEAIRLGGVVGVGPTQEGGVTGQGQASEFGLALPSLHCFSFIPVPGGRICERSRARRALYR